MTFFFLKWGYCKPDSRTVSDGIVQGTSGGDLIGAGYVDADGDKIDGGDAKLAGEVGDDDIVDAGKGNDTIHSLKGNDEVFAGGGDDSVDGGSGNDVIYGDSSLGTVGTRESFNWDKIADPDGKWHGKIDDGDRLGHTVQDTGEVNVTFDIVGTSKTPKTTFSDDTQKVHSIIDDGSIEDNSSLESSLNEKNESATYRWTFSNEVSNVSFRVNDIDYSSNVVIKAYDADGNLLDIQIDAGSGVKTENLDAADGSETLTSKNFNAAGHDTSPEYSALVTIAGPVARLEITHTQLGNQDSEVNITDIFFNNSADTTAGDDTLLGGDGDDTIYGEGGNDSLVGGAGKDKIYGGDDRDVIVGGNPGDFVDGGEGGDDCDTLDLSNSGPLTVEYDVDNAENGTVTFFNDKGECTGTMRFINIEKVIIPAPKLDGIVEGDAGDNLIDIDYTGDPEGDRIDAGDNIFPFKGPNDDWVLAGDGNDTVYSGEGQDAVYGEGGDDYIDTSAKSNKIDGVNVLGTTPDPDEENDRDFADGGAGNDTIFTGDDRDTIRGGDGNDFLNGGIDNDLIYGDAGDDTIVDDQGSDTIYGGDGNDSIVAGVNTLSDYDGDQPGSPYFVPGFGWVTKDPLPNDGRDLVDGGAGNDTIYGGDDSDTLIGGEGNDLINGGIDDDVIDGGDGNDTILGGHGSDTIDGGAGDDLINGGDPAFEWGYGDDDGGDAFPDNGRDLIRAGDGNDTVYGDDDDDTIHGDAGDDELHGGLDEDEIHGGAGNDTLYGDEGDDTLYGGDGQDTLLGGVGNDSMMGGADEDYFAGITYTDKDSGDYIDGGSTFTTGTDFDTLDLTGSAPTGGRLEIEYTSPDQEDGIVHYFDANNVKVGEVKFFEIEKVIPCFTPGTVIATPKGERLVEELREGDRVITRDNGIQEIRWVGTKALTGRELAANEHMKPVLIQKGSLGYGLPERDMLVSPNHRVLVNNDKTALYFEEREVLVAAKHLTGMPGVDVVNALHTTYIHFMFDRHEVVLSNGAWTESFQPGELSLDGVGNAQRNEIFELFPELKTADGLREYHSARRTLKKHEARLLAK